MAVVPNIQENELKMQRLRMLFSRYLFFGRQLVNLQLHNGML